MTETFIISVGGSLICPDKVDHVFVNGLKKIVLKHVEDGKKFILVTGGGRKARNYQEDLKNKGMNSSEALDLAGIRATHENAEFLRRLFETETLTYPFVIKDPTKKIDPDFNIWLAGGWKPGNSTDYVAVLLAKQLGVKKLINLTDVGFVYDKDPDKFKDAKALKEISWKYFRKIVGDEWHPGLNKPFDPIASKEAEQLGLTIYILNGKKLEELNNLLEGKSFEGTIIENQ